MEKGLGWDSLRKAISIRDRLTHPHSMDDLNVTNEELMMVEKAMEFFRDTTIQLLGNTRKQFADSDAQPTAVRRVDN